MAQWRFLRSARSAASASAVAWAAAALVAASTAAFSSAFWRTCRSRSSSCFSAVSASPNARLLARTLSDASSSTLFAASSAACALASIASFFTRFSLARRTRSSRPLASPSSISSVAASKSAFEDAAAAMLRSAARSRISRSTLACLSTASTSAATAAASKLRASSSSLFAMKASFSHCTMFAFALVTSRLETFKSCRAFSALASASRDASVATRNSSASFVTSSALSSALCVHVRSSSSRRS